jgi:hypothetical protein
VLWSELRLLSEWCCNLIRFALSFDLLNTVSFYFKKVLDTFGHLGCPKQVLDGTVKTGVFTG